MGFAVGGTHDVGGGGAVVAGVGRGAGLAVGVGRPRGLPLVDHQVYRHLALQAADVAVTEVIAQLVHLHNQTTLVEFRLRLRISLGAASDWGIYINYIESQ